jgi:tetratricopeptide (TPR) repeat protein/predicted Holliday junction resolvase-like endonuclease
MSFKNIIFIIISCIVFAACKPGYTENKTILQAESVLYSQPDSAYCLLTSIENPEELSEADYAAWCLHYTHAQYKLYMDIKSDSLINMAINYFNRTDLVGYTGTAYYLAGCIAQKLQDNKRAMSAYKHAADLLEKTDKEDLKGLNYFKIGHIYFQDNLDNQSLTYYKKSASCFTRSGNKRYLAYSYRVLSDLYTTLKYPFKDAINCIDQAIKLSKEAGDSINYYSNISRKGELLINTDYQESKRLLLRGYHFIPDNRCEIAVFLSLVYYQLNMIDSARYYLNTILPDSTSVNKSMICLAGAYVSKGEGNHDQAFHYLKKAYVLNDSSFQRSTRNQLYRIDKQYDLTEKQKENAQLKIANQQKVIIIIGLTLIVLAILFILLLLRSRHKSIQAKLELENQRLEFENSTKRMENEQKRTLLLAKLKNKIENTLQFNRLKMGFQDADKHDEFIMEVAKQAIISEKEWKYYIDEVNHLFDNKINELKARITGLTPHDLIVISLICLDIDITNACNLLDMSSNTMYTRRVRLKNKIGITKEVDLEKWLKQNVAIYE